GRPREVRGDRRARRGRRPGAARARPARPAARVEGPPMSTTPTVASRFGDPVARNYLFVGLAAQFVVAAAVLARPGSNLVAALAPAALAALGLVGRLTAMPYIALAILSYLLVVPTVTPFAGYIPNEVTRFTHFRLTDVVLAAAVLVYFA